LGSAPSPEAPAEKLGLLCGGLHVAQDAKSPARGLGFDETNGHPLEQHQTWVMGYLGTLEDVLE
jgi:hypothetical protein